MATLANPLFIQIGRKRYQVDSFEQASRMFCKARDAMGEGASRTPCPPIVDETGKTIGYVAYNGRVFAGTPQAWTSTTPILYDNQTQSEAHQHVAVQLSAIRKAMAAALRETPKNLAEYHRLGDEHRKVLHAINPWMKAAWETSMAREAAR